MAVIGIVDSPDQYAPVWNPIEFTVGSTNYAQANHNFICDIYINSASTMTARLKFPAYPGNATPSRGAVDISGILKNYLSSNVPAASETGFSKNGNAILRYDVYFGEQYGPSSGVTTYPNIASTSGYAFAGSLPYVNLGNQFTITDWVLFDSSNYLYANTIKYLTDAPRTVGINIRTGEDYTLGFLSTQSSGVTEARVVYYNSSGAQISTQNVNNPYNVGLYDTRLLRFACGPANLTVPASTAYYIVYLYDSGGSVSSEGFRFNIDTNCSNAQRNYRFMFKNRYGVFDFFTFMGQYERTSDIKKEYYKTIGGAWASSVWTRATSDRSDKQYNTIINDTFKCQSGWITQAESDWLASLIESPEVYVYHPGSSTSLVAVNIVDTNYTYKTTSRDQLFNLELSFKPTFNSVRQQF